MPATPMRQSSASQLDVGHRDLGSHVVKSLEQKLSQSNDSGEMLQKWQALNLLGVAELNLGHERKGIEYLTKHQSCCRK